MKAIRDILFLNNKILSLLIIIYKAMIKKLFEEFIFFWENEEIKLLYALYFWRFNKKIIKNKNKYGFFYIFNDK